MRKIHLIFILDRSGSMSGLEDDTIGGYNGFLKPYKDQQKTRVSTVLFDHKISLLFEHQRASNAMLSSNNYQVRGATALLDALGHTVTLMRAREYFLDTKEQRIYIITTDGEENASKQFTYQEIHQLIAEERRNGHEFVFLGANIAIGIEADKLGIKQEFTHTYQADKEGTREMYCKMEHMVQSLVKED